MKLHDVLEIAELYSNAMSYPSADGTRFGCDCGCGGDTYTPEMWSEEEQQADEAWKELAELCKIHGVEVDAH